MTVAGERLPTVLIVDDEPALLDVLDAYLRADGFAVLTAGDGIAAVETTLRERPDLVILDLNLPRRSGLDAFRDIRRVLDVPIIMLTARGAEVDRVVGLELGADDYVTKPYSPREVVARVRTVLRRRVGATPPPASLPPTERHEIRRIGDLTIDRTAHEVRRGSKAINVTPTEFRLLEVFGAHPGQAFTRDRLVELVAGDGGGDAYDRTLDRHIANLRHKIEDDAQHPRYILTVYGVGYKAPGA